MTKTIPFAPPRGKAAPAPSGRSSESKGKTPRPIPPETPARTAKPVPASPPSEARRGPRVATVSAREVLEAARPRRKAAQTIKPALEASAPAAPQKNKPAISKTPSLPLDTGPATKPLRSKSAAKPKPAVEMRPQVIVTLTLPLTLEPEPAAKLAPRAKKPAAPPTVPPVEPPAAKVKPAKAPKPPVPASKTPVPAPAKPAKAEEKTVSAKRGRRSKIPDNLAEQYGQNLSRRAATAPVEVESESPRKRMTREEREKRRQLMAPDPGLLQRLARAHAAASTAPKRASKPRGWELRCGRCGTVTRFTTPGAVCPKCGAIGLKDSLG